MSTTFSSAGEGSTCTVQLSLIPLLTAVAVTVMLPWAFACTRPSLLTLATDASLEVKMQFSRSNSGSTALSWRSMPVHSAMLSSSISTSVAGPYTRTVAFAGLEGRLYA